MFLPTGGCNRNISAGNNDSVGMGEYLVSLLVWIDLTKLTNEP